MRHSDIIDWIEVFAPVETACEWDNVGLMAGSRDDVTKSVIFCLDLTADILEKAARAGINLIITHHPLIFDREAEIRPDSVLGKKLATIAEKKITVYSAHTNLDYARGGVNDVFASRLGLVKMKTDEDGLHRFGELPEAKAVSEFVDEKTADFNSFNSKVVLPDSMTPDDNIVKIGVCCGSFDGETDWLVRNGLDLLVTGEMKHHHAILLKELGIAALELGHYESEIDAVKSLAAHVKKSLESQLQQDRVPVKIASKTNPYCDILFIEENGLM